MTILAATPTNLANLMIVLNSFNNIGAFNKIKARDAFYFGINYVKVKIAVEQGNDLAFTEAVDLLNAIMVQYKYAPASCLQSREEHDALKSRRGGRRIGAGRKPRNGAKND